jgi:hypothetical protein
VAAPSRRSVPSKVTILVNAELKHSGKFISASPVTEQMLKAFKTAIFQHSQDAEVEILTPAMVRHGGMAQHRDTLVCPLTIDLPERFSFPQQKIFQACRQVETRRQWVQKHTAHRVCNRNYLGDHWLPIIYTAKGPMYGEVIGEGVMPNFYHQPIDLQDEQRQNLYCLGYQLLDSLEATPGVYLLQFSFFSEGQIIFDRLWPFPAAPAIASLRCQQPDLFTCHWRCLMGQSISDVIIPHSLAS